MLVHVAGTLFKALVATFDQGSLPGPLFVLSISLALLFHELMFGMM